MKNSFSKKLIKIGKWLIGIFIGFKILFYFMGRFDMKNTIEEKSGVEISFFYKTIENDVFHTPGAFDSDYTWNYKLKVNESDFESMSTQIESSKFYNSKGGYNFAEPIYDSLRIYNLKGFWTSEENFYKFYGAEEEWAERTDIEIDKKERTIKVDLVHL